MAPHLLLQAWGCLWPGPVPSAQGILGRRASGLRRRGWTSKEQGTKQGLQTQISTFLLTSGGQTGQE